MSQNRVQQHDGLEVQLAGEVVPCRSYDDAAAIKAADRILCGKDLTPHAPDYLERVVSVLLRYGRTRAACLVSGSVIGLLSHCVGQMAIENRDARPDVESSQQADDNSDVLGWKK